MYQLQSTDVGSIFQNHKFVATYLMKIIRSDVYEVVSNWKERGR